jgi:hypothetical protein
VVLVGAKAQRAFPFLHNTGLRFFTSADLSPKVRSTNRQLWDRIAHQWVDAARAGPETHSGRIHAVSSSAIHWLHPNPTSGFRGHVKILLVKEVDLLHADAAAIAAFAGLDHNTAMRALRAEADYEHGQDKFIDQYIDAHGGADVDDARYDTLHSAAQETPAYEEFCRALRAELIEYFDVTEEQLNLAVILRHDDSQALWDEVNKQRAALGTGEVRGDL